jgi:hypothetical protein
VPEISPEIKIISGEIKPVSPELKLISGEIERKSLERWFSSQQRWN